VHCAAEFIQICRLYIYICFDEWTNLMLDELYDALLMLLMKEASPRGVPAAAYDEGNLFEETLVFASIHQSVQYLKSDMR
jgi:hypothetical protein